MDDPSADGLIALIRWYAEMGVDVAVDDAPHDRFAEARAASNAKTTDEAAAPAPGFDANAPAPSPARGARALRNDPVAPAQALEEDAREAAASAQSLEELRAQLMRFNGCGLKATATQLVFGEGEPGARVMFVGEAPGADEDRIGRPFVGRAGQLLDKMLASIGLARSDVYIANVVPWRPPGNRTPTPIETSACLPFVKRQIELVRPEFLICLGAASAQTMFAARDGIKRLRGRWFDYPLGAGTIKAAAMLHPAYLLRQPAEKRLAWQDLRMLARKLLEAPRGG